MFNWRLPALVGDPDQCLAPTAVLQPLPGGLVATRDKRGREVWYMSKTMTNTKTKQEANPQKQEF